MKRPQMYKILTAEDWMSAKEAGVTATALDQSDGYVHLSTFEQIGETLALHYKGIAQVRLLEYVAADLARMGEVKWEPSRGGQLFPHLYGALKLAEAKRAWVLNLDPSGIPALPNDL